jgi:hypothetical protein
LNHFHKEIVMDTFAELVLKHGGVLRPAGELSENTKAALLKDVQASGRKAPEQVAQFPTEEVAQAFEREVNIASAEQHWHVARVGRLSS